MKNLIFYLTPNDRQRQLISSILIVFLITITSIGNSAAASQSASTISTQQDSLTTQQDTIPTRHITGCVKDSKGSPMIGISVYVKDMSSFDITDLDGKFALDVADGSSFTVMHVGCVTLVVNTDDKSQFEITLRRDYASEQRMDIFIDYGRNYSRLSGMSIGVASRHGSKGKGKGKRSSKHNTQIHTNQESVATDSYTEYGESIFLSASDTPTSTFSIDADGASFASVRKMIHGGSDVPAALVRVEEFLNYFTFDYPEPDKDENIALDAEISTCPWNSDNYLLRLGVKGKTIEREQLPPSNYVILIDVSSSMSSSNKLDFLKEGLMRLADNLRNEDRVSIVTCPGSAKKLLEPTLGRDKEQIKKAISTLDISWHADGGSAIKTAYKTALEFFVEGGNNRVILATDGSFNVGVKREKALVKLVEKYLNRGIHLTVLGVGYSNRNDSVMEQIANRGNGNYECIDCVEQFEKVFINEYEKLYTIAKDSKIQVEFNPDMVKKYRLIGYENRALETEDFKDDKKDAGEIGVGQTITALYEVIPQKDKENSADIAEFYFRYKKPNESKSRELKQTISGNYENIDAAELSENQRFAAAVAMFGMHVKGSEFSEQSNEKMILELIKESLTFDPFGYRSEFVELVKSADIKR